MDLFILIAATFFTAQWTRIHVTFIKLWGFFTFNHRLNELSGTLVIVNDIVFFYTVLSILIFLFLNSYFSFVLTNRWRKMLLHSFFIIVISLYSTNFWLIIISSWFRLPIFFFVLLSSVNSCCTLCIVTFWYYFQKRNHFLMN